METEFKNKKLLIVEDDNETITLLESILSTLGFDVETAFDGLQGINKITNNSYDLILTDLDMPILNGYDMIEKTYSLEKNLNIIIISSYTKDYVTKNLNNDKISILTKPFNINELIELTKKTLLI